MAHRREAPQQHRDCETDARADAIHEAARQQQADRIRELEAEDDVGVVDLAPAVLLLQRRLQDADHLSIDVVDRRRQEQQQADHPPVSSDTSARDRRPRPFVASWSMQRGCHSQMVGLRRWMANSR
jgi:hypothetical protein